jgi:hypothetical protein
MVVIQTCTVLIFILNWNCLNSRSPAAHDSQFSSLPAPLPPHPSTTRHFSITAPLLRGMQKETGDPSAFQQMGARLNCGIHARRVCWVRFGPEQWGSVSLKITTVPARQGRGNAPEPSSLLNSRGRLANGRRAPSVVPPLLCPPPCRLSLLPPLLQHGSSLPLSVACLAPGPSDCTPTPLLLTGSCDVAASLSPPPSPAVKGLTQRHPFSRVMSSSAHQTEM